MSSIMSTRIGRTASLVCLSILLSGWSSVWAQESRNRFETSTTSQSQSALSDRQTLYVVVACPAGQLTDLYPAYLFAVDQEAKRVKVVHEIFDAASGTAWVRPYYEQGLVIVADTIYGISIIPKDGKRTRRYRIIDMKAPDKLKEVTFAFPEAARVVDKKRPGGNPGRADRRPGLLQVRWARRQRLRLLGGVPARNPATLRLAQREAGHDQDGTGRQRDPPG